MRLIAFLSVLILSQVAWADIEGAFRNSAFENPGFTLESRILGRNCFSLPASPYGLSCNPAYLADEEKQQLRFNIVADNTFGDVQRYNDYVGDEDFAALLDAMEEDGSTIYSRASSNLWYQDENGWAISYTPYRAGLISHLRNPVLTEVTAHAFTETELSLRTGLLFSEDYKYRMGFNLRYVKTQFMREQFLILDALSNSDLVNFKKQEAIYIDPALVYHWGGPWKPEFSLAISNLGFQLKDEDQSDDASVELGYATTPEFLDDRLRTSLHYSSRNDVAGLTHKVTWGGTYELYEHGHFAFKLAGDSFGLGYMGRWDSLTYGIGYQEDRLYIEDQELNRVRQTLLELGLSF